MYREDLTHFTAPIDKIPFYFELTGVSFCDGTYEINRACSPFVVIEYVTQGTGCIEIDGGVYHPVKDQIYILRSKTAQHYYADARDPWVKMFFNIGGGLCEELLQLYGISDKVIFDGEGLYEDFKRILDISRDKTRSQDGIFAECAPLVHKLIIKLSQRERENLTDREMLKLIEYLSWNYNRIVPNRELASLVYLSEDRCIKRFKAAFGTTPYEYQIREKINGAKSFLRDTNMTVGEISEYFGYSDQHYFSNLFKSRTGRAPSEYRREKTGEKIE